VVTKRWKTKPANTPTVATVVEDILRCKWTLHVLGQVRTGVNRPGQLVRTAPGLTTKVMNERLVRLVRNGVLTKVAYAERPAHVEYYLTPFGARLNVVLDAIDALQRELDRKLSRRSRGIPAQSRK
jgi:DNA-binding HxlR family transcriptional regulator